jgi:putative MATE family efflux protein
VGLPFAFIAMGAQGYLRGLGDLKTPLLIIGAANAANVVLELVFVFGLAWGIKGSAAATALAQLSMGAAFIYRARSLLLERFDGRAALRLFAVGWRIFVRSLSLHGTILFAAAVATRAGDASIAAHQITFQLWIFLALSLDAFAIAGQVVVAHRLGGGDRDAVLFVAGRVIRLAVLAGLGWAGAVALLYDFLPRLFTTDPAVITRMHAIWPIFVAILPISAAVYALEGILFGVGDVGYLMWATLAAAATGAALCLAVSYFNIGIIGVWSALAMMNMVRFATLSWRYRRGRWAVVAAHGALA